MVSAPSERITVTMPGSLVAKNEQLMADETGELFDVLEHPNQARYPGQRILGFRLNGYVHLVPYSESDDQLFLKTIIPSRRAQRLYTTGPSHGENDA